MAHSRGQLDLYKYSAFTLFSHETVITPGQTDLSNNVTTFFFCNHELWAMTLTVKSDLDRVKLYQRAKYQDHG